MSIHDNYTQVGTFGVDSGTVMIIDPCYVLKDDRGDDYSKETEYLRNVMPTCEAPYYGGVRPDDYSSDCGMVFSTLYGDGEYPIYAETNSQGRIVRLIIDFDDHQEDHEDDEDECDRCGATLQWDGTCPNGCDREDDDEDQ